MVDSIKIGRAPLSRRPPLAVQGERQAIAIQMDFAAEAAYEVNIGLQQGQQVFGFVQTIYIDNSLNPNNVTIMSRGTGFTTTIPAYALGFFPIDSIINDTLDFYSVGSATGFTNIKLYNYVISPSVWYSTDPIAPGFSVISLLPIATLVIPRNYTLIAATAHNVFPAVATPDYKWARNMSNDVVFWQINADATAVPADNFQMNPGEGFGPEFELPFRTGQRISMYSTGGGFVMGMEWTTS